MKQVKSLVLALAVLAAPCVLFLPSRNKLRLTRLQQNQWGQSAK